MTPKVSVIVPVYKAEKYLHRCVDSILAQTFQDFELLLIDDGSPDRSGEICDEYTKSDCRVRVFHKENGGVSSARNMGIKHAVGDWISFVDSDDYIEIGYLDYFFKPSQNVDIIHFGLKKQTKTNNYIYNCKFDERLIDICDFFSDYIFSSCCVSYFFKTRFILENKIAFNAMFRYSEDRLFIIESVLTSKSKLLLINNCCYIYSYNPNSAVNVKRNFVDSISDLQILKLLYSKYSFLKEVNSISLYLEKLFLNSFIYVYSLQCKNAIKSRKLAVKEFAEVLMSINVSSSIYYYIFISFPLLVVMYRRFHYNAARMCKLIFNYGGCR